MINSHLDTIDEINAELKKIDTLADYLMTVNAEDLRKGTIMETGIMISEAVERISESFAIACERKVQTSGIVKRPELKNQFLYIL